MTQSMIYEADESIGKNVKLHENKCKFTRTRTIRNFRLFLLTKAAGK